MNGENLNQQNNPISSNNNLNQGFNGGYSNSTQQTNYNQYGYNGTGNNNNNKVIYIILGVALLVVVLGVLYFTMGKKDDGYKDYNDYDDYLKNEEKENEKINKNFTVNGYKTFDGILIELINENNVVVDTEFKIEFYGENGNIVNVEDGNMFDVAAKGKGYEEIYVDKDLKYETYKVTAKLEKSFEEKTYNDKIEIVSSSTNEDTLIVQVKNNSDVKLSNVNIGAFLIGENNTIIEYESASVGTINANETVSEKIYLPYDVKNHSYLKYDKIDFVVVTATR